MASQHTHAWGPWHHSTHAHVRRHSTHVPGSQGVTAHTCMATMAPQHTHAWHPCMATMAHTFIVAGPCTHTHTHTHGSHRSTLGSSHSTTAHTHTHMAPQHAHSTHDITAHTHRTHGTTTHTLTQTKQPQHTWHCNTHMQQP